MRCVDADEVLFCMADHDGDAADTYRGDDGVYVYAMSTDGAQCALVFFFGRSRKVTCSIAYHPHTKNARILSKNRPGWPEKNWKCAHSFWRMVGNIACHLARSRGQISV